MPQWTAGLAYDRESQRWCLGGVDLHCGDGFEVRVAGHWLPVRVEHEDLAGWVLLADGDRVRLLPSRSLPARPDPRDGRW
jgi:hypothetical protein